MIQTRKEMKATAKRALLGHYGVAVGSILLYYLAIIAAMIPIMLLTAFTDSGRPRPMSASPVFWALILIILLANILFMAGLMRICYQIVTGQKTVLSDLLFGLRHYPLRFIGLSLVLFLIGLVVTLPGLLLIVVGLMSDMAASTALTVVGYLLMFVLAIAVTLRYALALTVMVETPGLRVMESIRISRDLMAGNKKRLVMLWISFAGVYLLGYLSLGIGFLWVMPYLSCTSICFYLAVKEEKNPPVRQDYDL